MTLSRAWVWRGAALIAAGIMVGVVTVNAMPAKLPEELSFVWKLNPKIQDVPQHVGCANSESVYPSTTLTIDRSYDEFNVLLKGALKGKSDWVLTQSNDKKMLVAQKQPWVDLPVGSAPSIEVQSVQQPGDSEVVVVITDYRKPYNEFSKWFIKLRGK